MSRPSKIIIVVIIIAGCALAAFYARAILQHRKASIPMNNDKQTSIKVVVQPVQTQTLAKSTVLNAEIEALAAVDIIPKVSGRLESLKLAGGTPIEEGVPVQKGEVIAVIEHSALKAAVNGVEATLMMAQAQAKPEVIESKIVEAKAARDSAKGQLAEAEAALKNLKKERDRMIALCEQGICSIQERDKVVSSYDASVERQSALKAQLERAEATLALVQAQTRELAEAEVAQAKAALDLAQINLDEATIEAPISGIVVEKFVDEGDMVGPGKPLITIADIDTVKVIGNVIESYLPALMPEKTTAMITVDAYPGQEFKGILYNVGAQVDRPTRSVKVEVRISNAGRRLKPGMFARMTLILENKENATVVPAAAVLHQDSESYVYVINNSIARHRVLKLGISDGILYEVIEGLKPAEQVIIKGQSNVRDGDKVEIVKESLE